MTAKKTYIGNEYLVNERPKDFYRKGQNDLHIRSKILKIPIYIRNEKPRLV